jgi:formylglycine-generating enzyme required for sulfatase activity
VLLQSVKGGFEPFWTDVGLSQIINPSMVLSRVYHYIAKFLEKQGRLCLADHSYKSGPWDQAGASALQHSFCERFFFLAPEQKQGIGAHADLRAADRYAFGILAYYLLTSEFPEGAFAPPSQKVPSLKYPWDKWILSLLSPDPLARPANLATTLEEEVVYSKQVTAVQRLKAATRPQEALIGGGSESMPLKPLLRSSEMQRPTFDPDPAAAFQVDNTVSNYRPTTLPREASDIEPLLSPMAVVTEGTYVRGSNQGARDEMPRHAVTVKAFAIDIHPVTNEQFVLFLEALGGEKDAQNNDILRLKDSRIRRSSGRLVIESGYEQHPVVGVTWYGAIAYAKWIGKRLPTEAEWEIAASAGNEEHLYPNGVEIDRTQANFFSSDTTPICSYAANPLGLYDMAGNVYEWCQDWYDYHYYDASAQEPLQPKGPSQGVYRVLRGGCWKSSKEDLRCAHRHRNNPGAVNGTYGFRCAADVGHS